MPYFAKGGDGDLIIEGRIEAACQGMEVRNAWGDVAMSNRDVRVGMVALILAVPWLSGAVDPASPGHLAGRIGTMLLTDLVLALGLLWAGRERRALLSSRLRAQRSRSAVVAPGPVEPAAVPVRVPSSHPVTVAPAI